MVLTKPAYFPGWYRFCECGFMIMRTGLTGRRRAPEKKLKPAERALIKEVDQANLVIVVHLIYQHFLALRYASAGSPATKARFVR
jgi:hypothetical protein